MVGGRDAAIQWLLPLAQPDAAAPPHAQRPAPPPTTRPRATPPRATIAIVHPRVISDPNIPPAPAAIEALPDDPFAAPPSKAPSADEIMQLARRDVGRIDKDLRKAFPERGAPPPPPDSKQARLERGINAAHEAVPPKWYQPAKFVEISPPGAHTRVYKVVTALLTYCISIQEDGRKSYSNCPN
jgi:hypothetical protein